MLKMLPNGNTVNVTDLKLTTQDIVEALGFMPAREPVKPELEYKMFTKTTRTVTTYDAKGNLLTTQKVVEVVETADDHNDHRKLESDVSELKEPK